jgi:hypothetical protein
MRGIEYSLEESADDNIPPEMREILKSLERQLESFRIRLNECRKNSDEFFQTMREFWQFMSRYYEKKDHDESIFHAFEKTDYFSRYHKEFSEHESYYVRANEMREAYAVADKPYRESQRFQELCDTELSKQTYDQTRSEAMLVDYSNCDTLVMVGCGPFPETTMYLYENTPIKIIIGLDQEQSAVAIAGDLLASLGIDKIQMEHAKGEKYDYSEADVIYVANFVSPKREVFEHIAETAKPNTKIITRHPVSFGKMLYEDTLANIPPRLTVKRTGQVNPYFLFQGLLLVKEESEI